MPSPSQTFERAAAEAKPAESRSVSEVLQLARIAAQDKLEGVRRLEQDLKRDPQAIRKKPTLSQLRKLLNDPATAQQALAVVATLPAPAAPDLLYEVWTGTPVRTETTELARSLLMTRELRASASEPLSLALDLRAAETCDSMSQLLGRARQVGDRRASGALAKWKRTHVCGLKSTPDCCTLDQLKEVDATITALKARPAPSLLEGP